MSDVLRRDFLKEGSIASGHAEGNSTEVDTLEQRIENAVQESSPKPVVGPAVSAKLGTLMDLYVSKPEFVKVMKISEKYPRPENVPSLVTPDVTQEVDKTLDNKVTKEDKRLRNDQICTSAALSCLGGVLDIIRTEKGKNPKLIQAGEMVLDSITMLGFVHNEFTSVRLKAFKQTVHPSYGDVFTTKPHEPEMLMGKTPISEQVKSLDELNKLKQKLKKPESNTGQKSRDFRKRGEYQSQRNQYKSSRPYAPRRREERRNRYFSPKGNYRKSQQDNRPQEDKKSGPTRN